MVAGGLMREDPATGCKAVIDKGTDAEHARKVFAFAKDMLRIASKLMMPTGAPLMIRVGGCAEWSRETRGALPPGRRGCAGLIICAGYCARCGMS